MGIDPKIWGNAAWTLIHTTAFLANNMEMHRMAKHMYYSMLHILPCEKCRRNFDTHLVQLPVPGAAKELGRWSWELHKRITPENITFSEAQRKWSGKLVNLDDINTFLESVAQTHPGARYVDIIYRDNLYNFVLSLMYFIDIKRPAISKEICSSRYQFKIWLKKLKKEHMVSPNYKQLAKCNVTCRV